MTDTFGNVVLEGLASGLPVVSYACAAAKLHVQSGHNGATARCFDPESFVDAALSVARNGIQRREMGTRAWETAQPLDWDRVVDAFTDTLQTQLERAGPIRSLPERAPRPGAARALPWSLPAE